jgi:hypothetical protein
MCSITRRLVGAFVVVAVVVLCSIASAQTPKKPVVQQSAKPAAAEKMTNATIVRMVKIGLGPDVIITSIESGAPKAFDLSAEGLIELKTAGVSDPILRAMQKFAVPVAGNGLDVVPKTPEVSSVPKTPAPNAVALPDGTQVRLRLMREISSETAKPGGAIELEVASDVVLDGQVVIKKATPALGKIVSVTKQLLTRGGKLQLAVDSVRAADGASLAVKGDKIVDGGRGLVRGNEAIVPAGTVLVATVQGDVMVKAAATTAASARAVERAAGTTGTTTSNPPREDVARPHEPGIYAALKGGLEPLDKPAVTGGGVSAGSMIKHGLSMGFKKAKAKADIRNAQAAVRVDGRTEFYFYGSEFNPSTFILAKLEVAGNKRQITIGEGGMMGVRNGISEKDQIAFTSERLGSGVFRITLPGDIAPGEYAFIDLSNTQAPRLWEFGVDR